MLLMPCQEPGGCHDTLRGGVSGTTHETKVGPRLTVPSLLAFSPHPPERGAAVGRCTEAPATVRKLKELDKAGETSAGPCVKQGGREFCRPLVTCEADHEWTGRAGGTVGRTLLAVLVTGAPSEEEVDDAAIPLPCCEACQRMPSPISAPATGG